MKNATCSYLKCSLCTNKQNKFEVGINKNTFLSVVILLSGLHFANKTPLILCTETSETIALYKPDDQNQGGSHKFGPGQTGLPTMFYIMKEGF